MKQFFNPSLEFYDFPHWPIYSGHIICQLYIYIYIRVKEIWTILTELLHNKNKGINLHAGVFTNFNTSIRVKEIWVNGPVRKIISNRNRPILKI